MPLLPVPRVCLACAGLLRLLFGALFHFLMKSGEVLVVAHINFAVFCVVGILLSLMAGAVDLSDQKACGTGENTNKYVKKRRHGVHSPDTERHKFATTAENDYICPEPLSGLLI